MDKNVYKQIPIGQAKDLTNQKFGHLTALYRTENNKTQTMWVCQCDCGVIKPMAAQYFTKAKDPSCGCQNKAKASNRMKKYNDSQRTIKIGDKFGKLTVVKYDGLKKQFSRDKNESWYICQCDCGGPLKSIRGNDLTSSNVISCGCISSKGEQRIKEILEENKIVYQTEYTFPDLLNPKTNYRLRFDFAVFNNDNLIYLIEFDGRQHFTGPDTSYWGRCTDTLEDIQFRDNLKDEYCKSHNLILKRIPYFNLPNLSYEEIISSKFNIN